MVSTVSHPALSGCADRQVRAHPIVALRPRRCGADGWKRRWAGASILGLGQPPESKSAPTAGVGVVRNSDRHNGTTVESGVIPNMPPPQLDGSIDERLIPTAGDHTATNRPHRRRRVVDVDSQIVVVPIPRLRERHPIGRHGVDRRPTAS